MSQRQIKAARRQAKKEISKLVPNEVHKALLEIKKWSFKHRWQFSKWLLFGRGEWKGVK